MLYNDLKMNDCVGGSILRLFSEDLSFGIPEQEKAEK
jgi:hypothetical protein